MKNGRKIYKEIGYKNIFLFITIIRGQIENETVNPSLMLTPTVFRPDDEQRSSPTRKDGEP